MLERLALIAIVQLCVIATGRGAVPQITNLNVQCDRSGVRVNVNFDGPFNGIIFSKGHYSDLSCRYVQPNGGATAVDFAIPVDKCGTNTLDIDGEDGTPPKRGFENIVVFQNDPTYQEVWDHARMVVCRYSLEDDFDLKEKRVVFRPVVIDMLDVVSIPVRDADGQQSRVDCWMEITRGRFPQTSPIDTAVKVGSPLTLAIFVRDPRKRTDIRVKDCYAYDDPQVAENNGPALLQLTDFDGCPTKPKLIEVWRRTLDAGPTGATVIAFTTVTAFKFPDRPDLQLTCNIELCRNQCAQRCASELPNPVSIGTWTTQIEDGTGVPSVTSAPSAPTTAAPTQTTEAEDDDNETGGGDDGETEETTATSVSTTEEPEGESEESDSDSDSDSTPSSTAAPSEEEEREGGEDEEEEEASTTTTTEAPEESENEDEEESNEDSENEETKAAEPKEADDATTKAPESEEPEESESKEEEEDKEEKEESSDDSSEESNEDESDNEESEDEETAESSKAKIKAIPPKDSKASKAKTTTTTTTTTTTAPTTSKRPKTTKKPKSQAKTKATTPKPKSPKSAAQVRPNEGLNSIEQIHWSTSTLRPLKELMDFSEKTSNRKANQKKSQKKIKTTTTSTTTTTTTTTTTPPTTKSSKKLKKPNKKSTTTTTTTTPKPNNRRARAPSSTHPEEFPHLHLMEGSKKAQPERRLNPFNKFQSMSQIKSTSISPNISSVVITEAFAPNLTSNRPSLQNRYRNSHIIHETTGAEQRSLNQNPLISRKQSIRRSDISANPEFEAFNQFRSFQALRIRRPNHRVVRSVDLRFSDPNSKPVIFQTRIHSALLVI